MPWSNGWRPTPSLALMRFGTDSGGNLLTVVGRRAGLVGWLALLGRVGNTTELTISSEAARVSIAGLGGQSTVTMPLTSISSTVASFSVPFWALVVGALAAVVSVRPVIALMTFNSTSSDALYATVGALVTVMCLLWHHVGRRLSIKVEAHSGTAIVLRFSPGLVDGVWIGVSEVEAACGKLDEAVLAAMAARKSQPEKATATAEAPTREESPETIRCAHCASINQTGDSFCANCGKEL